MVAPQGDELDGLTTGDEQTEATPGALTCTSCGYALSVLAQDTLPSCPACGGREFRRASIFAPPTSELDAVETRREPDAIATARDGLEGAHLAWLDADGELRTFALEPGWTRIGRSGAADVQLDDPTVSRRHALVVLTDEGELRALDDRSLNGLFVNGSRVEWTRLSDGDELSIGRFRLYVIA